MKKICVTIDDRLLEQVQNLLGTTSIGDIIDRALREVARTEARRQEIAALSEMDGLELANEGVMDGAWRS